MNSLFILLFSSGIPAVPSVMQQTNKLTDFTSTGIAITFLIFLVLLAVLFVIVNIQSKLMERDDNNNNFYTVIFQEFLYELLQIKKFILYIILGCTAVYIGFYLIKGTVYEPHVIEWLNLIVRWVHIVFGIAWIGASFYFVFLENALERKNVRDELAGNLWAIHGGGYYYLEKYKNAPDKIPSKLHWFKYEAYFTWITGFLLMCIVYYLNPATNMLNAGSSLSPNASVALGLGILFFSWFIYDFLCKSNLIQNPLKFFGIIFLFITATTWFLSQFLSSRAAYMHVGAMLGTWMAANVFMVIIPSQKAMVNAARSGKMLNPMLGINASRRSLHNNYFTLPVIFVMMSNHFPVTFGSGYSWIILSGLFLISAGVKHYFNLAEQGKKNQWLIPAAVIGIIALAIVSAPKSQKSDCSTDKPVKITQIQEIFNKRCVTCHSAAPTDKEQSTAPNGIMYDTPAQIKQHVERINIRAVITSTMPQGNKTGMTEKERELLGCWIANGAPIE